MEELYTLQREVGRGSYGVVFEGHMCQTGQKVAIKRLACRNPECMELYLQELWAMRSTGQQHANIIQLHRCLQQTGPRTLQALRPGQLPLRLVESVLKGTVSRTKHSPLQHRRRRSQGRKRLQDRTNSVQEDPLTPYRPPRKGSYGLRLQDRTNVAQEDPLTPHRPSRKGSYGLRLQEKTNSVQEDPLTPHRPPSKGSSHSAEVGAGPMRCLALWLVMEFCDGGNLNHFLLSRAPDQRSNHSVVQQLSAAVAFLHHLGIMHRDLKPDNVLVCVTDRGPVVKVADFGLSKMSGPVVEPLDHQHFSSCGSVVDPLTPLNHRHFSSTCGSDFYMAPEVWGGVAYTAQADIFSLGVMFWAVLERITFVEEGTTHQQLGAYVSRGRWLLPLGEALWENPALQLCIPMKGFKRGGAVDRPRPPGPAMCSLLLHMLQPDPDARPQADQLETRVQEALKQDQDQDLDQEPH